MCPSAAAAHLLQALTCCTLRDALLHSLVVMSGYFQLLLPFYQLEAVSKFSSDLGCQQSISIQRMDIFALLDQILCKL